ncbi:hypothetical protein, partial [Pseudomonas syringae group genomosp. 7]
MLFVVVGFGFFVCGGGVGFCVLVFVWVGGVFGCVCVVWVFLLVGVSGVVGCFGCCFFCLCFFVVVWLGGFGFLFVLFWFCWWCVWLCWWFFFGLGVFWLCGVFGFGVLLFGFLGCWWVVVVVCVLLVVAGGCGCGVWGFGGLPGGAVVVFGHVYLVLFWVRGRIIICVFVKIKFNTFGKADKR